MIETVTGWLTASDTALTTMGPLLTFVIAALAGGAMAQMVKHPLGHVLKDPGFSWVIRLVAFVASAFFAHFLSNSVQWPMELIAGLFSLAFYHAGVSLIRKFWPWLEISPLIGSASPPLSAYRAADARSSDMNTPDGA